MNKKSLSMIMLSFFLLYEYAVTQVLQPPYVPPPTEWDFEHPSTVPGFELDDNWPYTPLQASDGSIIAVGFSDRYNNGPTNERHPAILKFIPGPVRKIQWEVIPTFPAGAIPNITIADSGSGGFTDAFESNEAAGKFIYACGIIRKVVIGGISERIPVIAKFYLSTGFLVWFKEVSGFSGARFTRMAPVYNSSGVLTSIYIAGESSVGGGEIKATIFKLRPDGTLDPTFDGDGWRQYGAPDLMDKPTFFKDLAYAPDIAGLGEGFIAVGNVLKSGGPVGGAWTQPERDVFVVRLRADNGDMPSGTNWPRVFSENSLGIQYTDLNSPESPICGIDPESVNNEEGFSIKLMPDGNFAILCRFDFIELSANNIPNCYPFNTEQYYDNDMALIKIRADNGEVIYTLDAGRSVAIDAWNVMATAPGCNEIYICGNNFVNGYTLPSVIRVDDHSGAFVFRWRKDVTPKHEYACIFGICLTADQGIVVCGNNGENGDDYVLIKVANDKQVNYSGYNQMGTNISFPITWNTPRTVMGTIRIKNGGVLTIENTTIEFANTYLTNDWYELAQGGGTPTKIIVEPKGRLILRNCTLKGMTTNKCPAGNQEWMWEGIVLLGKPNLPSVPLHQGMVYMQQDAKIENAYIGVSVGNTWYNADGRANETLQDGGGILLSQHPPGTTSPHFLNCRRSVIYAPATHPQLSSYGFTNTNFLCDRPMLDINFVDPEGGGRLGISYFVGTRNRDGLTFYKCSFRSTGNYLEKARGLGLDNFDSRMSIHECRFDRLYTGVSAQYAIGVNDRVSIFNSIFSHVRHGGHIVGGAFHHCINNTFEDIPVSLFNDASYGLRFEGATNLTVSETNTFTSTNSGTYGVIIKDSYFHASEVGRNVFQNVDFGVQTEQNNTGLQIRCNSYTGTDRAWSINPATPANTPGLFSDQGSCGESANQAGNLFNDPDCPTPGVPESHIRSKVDFTYYARSGADYDPNEIPTCVSDGPMGTAGIVDVVLCGLNSNPDACTRPCYECEYAQFMLQQAQTETDPWVKQYLYNQAIHLYLEEGEVEEASEVLKAHFKDNPTLYLGALINTGDFVNAETEINTLSSSESDAADIAAFYQVMLDLAENGKYFTDIDEGQEAILLEVAAGHAPVKYAAQNILSHAKNYAFNRPVEVWIDEFGGVEERSEEDPSSSVANEGLTLRPNPTHGSLEVLWKAKAGIGTLEVLRIDGALLLSQRVNLNSGRALLSLKNEVKGLYVIRLTSPHGILMQKLMLK